MKRVYKRAFISGPVTGMPDANRAAFHEAAARLRRMGYEVENPADNADFLPTPPDWRAWMTLALNQLLRCECVIMLPGWENSRGAKIERQLAIGLGMDVMTLQEAIA
jgi:hypothetical protein